MERVLLIGNGGREHAIASAVRRSNAPVELYSFMGAKNPGIAKLCKESFIGDTLNPATVAKFALSRKIDLAVVGPEAPLEAGVVDELLKNEVECASPTRSAARMETDKGFARELLDKYRVRGSPLAGVFSNAKEAFEFIDSLGTSVVVKPAGLTGGKGVKLVGEQLKDSNEAKEYVKEILGKGVGGLRKVVVEEKLEGEEFSLQAFVDGRRVVGTPMVQDHKRAYDNDTGPNCYSEDTEILSEDGWKTFDRLKKSDRVAIFQPRFRRIRFERPKKIYWRRYKGKMVRFWHTDIDLLVTPNHRMLIQKRKGPKKPRLSVVEAKEMIGENYILQTGKWIGTTKKVFVLPESKNKYGVKKKRIKIKFEDWAEFLGLYLSEGSCTTKRYKRVQISQNKNSEKFKDMEKILYRLPFHVSYEKNRFRINSAQLVDYLKRFGRSHEKFIPKDIKNAKPEIIELFLRAFCLGDGCYRGSQMRICSSSKRLIDDIQELFLKIGKVGTISVDKRKRMLNPINKKYYPARPIYAIEVKKRQKASIRKNNIRWVEYDGYIGCVTVSTGFVIVRRNSRVAISGNTGGMGSYSDAGYILPFLKQEDYDEGISIMKASVEAFRKETGEDYRGFLYGGFMVTKDGVKLLEYNARLGDPEAMNTLSVIKSDFLEILERIVDGSLKDASFEKKATVCKYLVPEGYPVSPKKNELIEVDEGAIQRSGATLYYASVNEIDGKIYTGSSRTAGLVGIADTIENAERIAEGAMKFIKGKLFYRKDIGTRELIQKRIGHMKKLRGQ